MPRQKIERFEWSVDSATAPDGTRYAVFSEHVRHEPRMYWPSVYMPERNLNGLHTGGWKTVGDNVYWRSQPAMRRAERHWHETRNAHAQPE